jgi:hypothetical protein
MVTRYLQIAMPEPPNELWQATCLASTLDGTKSEDEILGGAFEKMIARGNQHNRSPVCYSQLSDGTWEVCLLQTDGSYGQCKGPIHKPICGG